MARSFSGKNDAAVENLLSQAKDLYVLEQVAKINCSGFTDDSSLPTNLETRFRRLKSLPVSQSDPVSSSSRKLLSHSKSMASYSEKKKKNYGNVSSASAFNSSLAGKSCSLDSSVDNETQKKRIKRNPSVNSRGGLGDFSDSGRIGSSSSRFSQQGKILSPTTQTLKLLTKEKSRISSSSFTSIDLASPSSDQVPKEGMKPKSKSKFLISWFDKLSLAQATGCLQGKSSSKSKKTEESSTEELSWEENFKKLKKRLEEESKQRSIKVAKLVKKAKRARSESIIDRLLGV